MEVNGWMLVAHPVFITQLEALPARVATARRRHPGQWRTRNDFKRLAAIVRLALVDIPRDPSAAEYRQGSALGPGHRHWFRARFYQQYRLFFRFDSKARVIVYAWVNDEDTKRAYESDDDAYAVFARMLGPGSCHV